MGIVTAANIKLGVSRDKFKRDMELVAADFAKVRAVNRELTDQFRAADRVNREYSKGIGRLSRDLTGMGRTLAVAVSLPLAVLGGVSADSYAQLERLEIGINAIEQSATLSKIAMQELVSVAKLPGLGIKEANQFYLALRNVNFSGEQATRTIKALGNAVALGGGGREQLGSLALQVPQLLAKGKVTQEDVKPIINASPVLSNVIQQLYGTLDTTDIQEKLAAAGKSSRDFVAELIQEVEKLSKVESGFANALENISDASFLFTAELGRAADESLGLTPALDAVTDALSAAAIGLKDADPAMKTFVTGLLAITAVVPLVIVGIGTIQTVLGTPWKAGLAAATRSWQVFTATMVAGSGGILAIGAALGALIYTTHVYIHATDTAINKAELHAKANDRAVESYSGQILKINELVKVAGNEAVAMSERIKAGNALAEVMGDTTGKINAETVANGEATASIESYIKAVKAKSLAQAYAGIYQEKFTEQIKAQTSSAAENITMLDQAVSRFKNFGRFDALDLVERGSDKKAANIKRLNKEMELLANSRDKILNENGLTLDDILDFGNLNATNKGGGKLTKEVIALAKAREDLVESTLREADKLEVENESDGLKRKKRLAQLEYEIALQSKNDEYENVKKPLDEAYFNWLRQRTEVLKNDLAGIDKERFSQLAGDLDKLTGKRDLSGLDGVSDKIYGTSNETVFGDDATAYFNKILDGAVNAKKAGDEMRAADYLINTALKGMEGSFADFDKGKLLEFAADMVVFKSQMNEVMLDFAGNFGAGFSGIIGEIIVGAKGIEDAGSYLLDSLGGLLKELSRMLVIKGIANLIGGNPLGGIQLLSGLGAGLGGGIFGGLAARNQSSNVNVTTNTRLRGSDIYNSGKGVVRLNGF